MEASILQLYMRHVWTWVNKHKYAKTAAWLGQKKKSLSQKYLAKRLSAVQCFFFGWQKVLRGISFFTALLAHFFFSVANQIINILLTTKKIKDQNELVHFAQLCMWGFWHKLFFPWPYEFKLWGLEITFTTQYEDKNKYMMQSSKMSLKSKNIIIFFFFLAFSIWVLFRY